MASTSFEHLPPAAPPRRKADWLARMATLCGWSIGLGQVLFLAFIALFYYPATVSGRFAHWNSKPLITGFQPGDQAGNTGFAVHVLLAGIITAAGLLQITPQVRKRLPRLHRWTGRVYLVTAALLALGGLGLVWVRGTYMNLTGAIGISFNAVVVLTCGAIAWRHAVRREFARHRPWALRLFVAASAVWFMRVAYMAWGMASGGAGIGERMDGPFDYFLAFGNTLVPLAVLEAYLRAGRSGPTARRMTAALLALAAVFILAGSAGAWLMMWSPYL